MTQEQFLFLMAIDEFKSQRADLPVVDRHPGGHPAAGLPQTMASELRLRSAEDWREPADSPANVRPRAGEKRGDEPRRRIAAMRHSRRPAPPPRREPRIEMQPRIDADQRG